MLPADLRQALDAAVARDTVVLASDFDGTLAPFVHDAMTARPVPGSIELLRSAARCPGVSAALVSGRDVDTLATLSGVPGESDAGPNLTLIGSHGAQSSSAQLLSRLAGGMGEGGLDEAARVRLAELDVALQEVQRRHPQSRIERKPAAVVLHTRGLREDVAEAALADAATLAERDGVHSLAGKSVLELSVVDTSKGSALRALADLVDAQAVIYFGDDVTDERAFEVLPAEQGHVTIKVGDGPTAAAHRVPGIDAVVEAIAHFVAARQNR
ncbi:trehalose-phosphatase [Kineosphaera limosa NBRC 100340]|uniref:Trehalose 6-phosphate phosphatase n=1 Tax=Kineosphaera limosa NBRC 100340 TaxID=1184609 RepID=K6W9G4_9MICO|nr:trehalose-phosphatase [Kineosphaera limosa]GAB95820.1 trehalose-phosphatase [Kineosphaera limosa NBRC 100340]